MRAWFRHFYRLAPTDPRYLDATDLQIEYEWRCFVTANPHLRAKDESYADPNYERDEEQELTQDARIDMDQVGPKSAPNADAEREKALEIANRLREQLAAKIAAGEKSADAAQGPEEDDWEDVPVE